MKYQLQTENFDYATHQPVLIKALEISEGPVLELGCGEGSTQLIHELCKKRGRKVVSVETDETWLKKYDSIYCGPDHEYLLINEPDYFATIDELCKKQWGLVFIDQFGWHNRSQSFRQFRNCSDYLVLHDCEQASLQGHLVQEPRPYMSKVDVGYRAWIDLVAYSKEFHPNVLKSWGFWRWVGPSTLIASQKYPCRDIEVDFSMSEIEL